ncbi:MAG TPA: hypothetical protein VKG45_13780 [Actinomycetes bacterium]|nr:hypothetical protein [Actinomycetes bacterium]
MTAGALISLGAAAWLLILALTRRSGSLPYVVLSLIADAAAFGFLTAALSRRGRRGASPEPPARL